MTEKKKENKFEFALFVNDYKIIQRYFTADDYNPKIRNSVDIREMVDDIVFQIQETLKKRDVDYQWENYDLRENIFLKKWNNEIKKAKKYGEL